MGNPAKIIIVIPVYNHGGTLRRVAEEAVATGLPVLVVDDGSTDGGAASLSGLSLFLLSHPENEGKGVAIRTAAAEALGRGMTHMITVDADDQHDIADLPQLIAEIEKDPDAIVVGKRRFDREKDPKASIHGRSFSNFWFRVQTGRSVGDAQSGYRAYPLFIFQHLNFSQTRFAFEVEVLVRSAWAGVRVRDVAVSVYYPPGKERISHFDLLRDNLRLTHLNAKLTLRSMVPWPHRKIFAISGKSGNSGVCGASDGASEGGAAKISLRHPLRSIRALMAERTTPGRLALAGALGVFLGALPLIACHTVVILMTCGFFRLNRVVAVVTSQLCMPPLVPAACIEVGYYLRNGRFLTEISMETLGYQGLDRLFEWGLGSLFVGPLIGGCVGLFIYLAAAIVGRREEAV